MATSLTERLDRITVKAELFAAKYNKLVAAKRESDRRIDELLKQIERQSIEISNLRRELAYHQMAGAIAPSRETVESSRAVLAEIVREIDKCISELTS